MLYAVIDIGSNSVRLMFSDGCDTLSKEILTTRLAEGMGEKKLLTAVAINRTADAVDCFYKKAVEKNSDQIYIFATAAVRQAKNQEDFILAVKERCGAIVEIISGKEEAELGYLGALNGLNGGVIDVGGASSEIIVVEDKTPIYFKSLDIGAVKIKDECGQDFFAVKNFVLNKVIEYGEVPLSTFYAIGGTATSIVALVLELEVYDSKKVDGFILDKNTLSNLVEKLFSMTIEERKELKGMHPPRAEVIAGGASLLLEIMNKVNINTLIVSEKDNLEGYLVKRLSRYE